MTTRKIGVWSGGGAKGLIQASCAAYLESTGAADFNKGFDLYVGASVGSINCSLLSSGAFTARSLINDYPDFLKAIFKKAWYPRVPFYDRGNFFKQLSQFVKIDAKFSDLKIKTAITSVDACSDQNFMFESWGPDGENLLASILIRSFAAPYYFGQVNDPIGQKVWYDGGCGSSNLPVDLAIDAAVKEGWLIGDDKVEFWLFGTGYSDESIPYTKASKGNFINQIMNFIARGDGGMARAQSRMDQVNRLVDLATKFPNIGIKYFDIEIPVAMDKMDDINHIPEYFKFGQDMAKSPLISINC